MKEQSELKTAEQLIIIERNRQVLKEGWTFEHDDQHVNGELAKAADCYYEYAEDNNYADKKVHQYWPWEPEWWKPKNQLHDYIKAGALYKAEFNRLERTGGAVGPKLTNIRIGIRQCEIRIDEILEHEAYCAKKVKDSSPIEGVKEASKRYVDEMNLKYPRIMPPGSDLIFQDGAAWQQLKERELTAENERLRFALDEIESSIGPDSEKSLRDIRKALKSVQNLKKEHL